MSARIVTAADLKAVKMDGQAMFLDGATWWEQRRGCKAHPALTRIDRGPRRGSKEPQSSRIFVDGHEVPPDLDAIADALTAYYAREAISDDHNPGAAHEPDESAP